MMIRKVSDRSRKLLRKLQKYGLEPRHIYLGVRNAYNTMGFSLEALIHKKDDLVSPHPHQPPRQLK